MIFIVHKNDFNKLCEIYTLNFLLHSILKSFWNWFKNYNLCMFFYLSNEISNSTNDIKKLCMFETLWNVKHMILNLLYKTTKNANFSDHFLLKLYWFYKIKNPRIYYNCFNVLIKHQLLYRQCYSSTVKKGLYYVLKIYNYHKN